MEISHTIMLHAWIWNQILKYILVNCDIKDYVFFCKVSKHIQIIFCLYWSLYEFFQIPVACQCHRIKKVDEMKTKNYHLWIHVYYEGLWYYFKSIRFSDLVTFREIFLHEIYYPVDIQNLLQTMFILSIEIIRLAGSFV